jgi:hypothetical protein
MDLDEKLGGELDALTSLYDDDIKEGALFHEIYHEIGTSDLFKAINDIIARESKQRTECLKTTKDKVRSQVIRDDVRKLQTTLNLIKQSNGFSSAASSSSSSKWYLAGCLSKHVMRWLKISQVTVRIYNWVIWRINLAWALNFSHN